jgi:hypothetical protein
MAANGFQISVKLTGNVLVEIHFHAITSVGH